MTRVGLLILVCGGRDFAGRTMLRSELDALNQREGVGCLVQGGAHGADTLAGEWAVARRIPMFECRAHWDTMGRPAGSLRNQWMLDWMKPDLVVAFPGGVGTADMVKRAKRTKVRVLLCPTP